MTRPKTPVDPREYRLENALKWIRTITWMHYFGGAFDPEHMRTLANIAADALAGERDLPDFDAAAKKSKKKARKWAARFGSDLVAPDKPDDEDLG